MQQNQWSPETFAKAWQFATIAHQGQLYGSQHPELKIPYINHIGSVTIEVVFALQNSSQNLNGTLAINCALLHDVLEDTNFKFSDIENAFGIETANGVAALTKNSLLTTEQKMHDSLNRIKQQPNEIWMVKMADRICNLQPPPYNWDQQKILKYKNESMLILQHLKEGNHFLAQKLQSKINIYGSII